jgi:hypothetical protein
MLRKFVHLNFEDGDTFMTGEIVAVHGCYCEVRPFHIGTDPESIEANSEPPHTILIAMDDLTGNGSRLFDSEEELRAWWAWLLRPETLGEARRRLRPASK